MQGVEIAARFALPPNSRSYCGKGRFIPSFRRYMGRKDAANIRALQKSLSSFTAHYAYLRMIARACNGRPFDRRVAEAFWIGNPLLRKVRKTRVASLITGEFCGPGKLPVKMALSLAKNLPDGFAPHHSFHSLYLHTISGVIAHSVKNADSCRVSWGKVISAGGKSLLVEGQRLVRRRGGLALLPCRRRLATSCAGIALLSDVKNGDLVASHWGVAVMKLSPSQARRLGKVTLQNIRAANTPGVNGR